MTKKPSFRSDFGPFDPNLGHQFFSNTQLHQSLDSIVSYHHVQYQKKTNDPILIRASDGRTDGRTDRWTDRKMMLSD